MSDAPNPARAQRSGITRVVIKNLTKTFGATAALRGVSCELKAGKLTLIEGANGSGKTTMLRIVGTIMRPTSGTVSYQPLGEAEQAVRAEIGWLSHEALAYGDLTGRANIEVAAAMRGLDPREAWIRARDRFELARFAERPLRTNSRGQQQRIALARALVHEPSLLLLDEPTTGLDATGVARVVRLVEQEVAAGAIVAVVSHELKLFRELADCRIVLDRGKVVDTTGERAA